MEGPQPGAKRDVGRERLECAGKREPPVREGLAQPGDPVKMLRTVFRGKLGHKTPPVTRTLRGGPSAAHA